MTPRDFDRLDKLIDTAAREMVSGEPSPSFAYDVMSRVRGRIEPASRRSVFAIGTMSAAALGALILIVMANRSSVPVRPLPERPVMPQARVIEQVTPAPRPELVAPRQEIRQAARRSEPSRPEEPVSDAPVMTSLEPLATEPIDLPALDVPSLEHQTTTIEEIEIEDLTIDPLVASND